MKKVLENFICQIEFQLSKMAKRDGHGISRQISDGMDTTDVTDNPHIEIQDAFTFQQFNENGEFILNQSSSPTQGYNSDGSQDSCHMEDASEMGLMSVKVKMGLNRVESVSGDKIPSYKMTSNPRGQALIIDIEKYDNEIQDERIGSKVILKIFVKMKNSSLKISKIHVTIN